MSIRSKTWLLRGVKVAMGIAALLAIVLVQGVTTLAAAEPGVVPKLGEFPPPNSGQYAAGELVSVDHVNRRGAIRLVGDGVDGNYHSMPSFRFALLPYGTLRYHGAPAELRDIPIGTVLHGYFLQAASGDPVFASATSTTPNAPKINYALTLEDDFSFYQRQGREWKIAEVDTGKGKLKVIATGKPATDGLKGEQMFDFDASTRVWKGRQIGNLNDLAPEQVVQLNLSWAPDWQNGKFQITDVWLDPESRETAAELQRQVHIRHQRHRWLAGWIDKVEHLPTGGGNITVTLFGGMDPSLYEQVRTQAKSGGVALAAAEPTLRTWWQEHDNKYGPVLDCKDIPNPPPGSSGLQFRVQIGEILEGYRPGRIVRVRPNGFPNVKMPPEERIQTLEDR